MTSVVPGSLLPLVVVVRALHQLIQLHEQLKQSPPPRHVTSTNRARRATRSTSVQQNFKIVNTGLKVPKKLDAHDDVTDLVRRAVNLALYSLELARRLVLHAVPVLRDRADLALVHVGESVSCNNRTPRPVELGGHTRLCVLCCE